MDNNIELNQYGFYSIRNKPTEEALKDYYAQNYYQNGIIYQNSYSEAELAYFDNKIEQKYQKIIQLGLLEKGKAYSILDVGCGEGFTLQYFKRAGWKITGLDYSEFGCKSFNPDCLPSLITGDIYQNIEQLITNGHRFDLIWLDNVLEHVLDPYALLSSLHQLSSDKGVLVIEVPNDFSKVQKYLLEKNYIDKPFWIVMPDHISYFNKSGLENICAATNWKSKCIMGDFPIDWFLFNEHSNYKKNSQTGKQAHKARVEIENLFHNISIEKTNQFYESMAALGVGRQLIGIFSKKT